MTINTRVRLKESSAKWHLDHPEIYFYGYSDKYDSHYDVEMQMHILACMGIPMDGVITDCNRSSVYYPYGYCFKVEFKIGKLKTTYWVEKKDLILL